MADNWCCYPPFLLKYCEAALVQCFSPANINDDRSINTGVHRKSTQTDQYVLLTLTSYWSTSWESSKPGTARTYPQGCEERNKERSRDAVKTCGYRTGHFPKIFAKTQSWECGEGREMEHYLHITYVTGVLEKLEYQQKLHLVLLTPCNTVRDTLVLLRFVMKNTVLDWTSPLHV